MARTRYWRSFARTVGPGLLSLAGASWLLTGAVLGAESPSKAESAGSSDITAVVGRIDELIEQGWQENGFRPARAATDAEWCRRVFLDMLGRVPTVAEPPRKSARVRRRSHRLPSRCHRAFFTRSSR